MKRSKTYYDVVIWPSGSWRVNRIIRGKSGITIDSIRVDSGRCINQDQAEIEVKQAIELNKAKYAKEAKERESKTIRFTVKG